ncbi:MAG: transposase [Synergistaceae bacterium]|nr:transposase [Synergistaceae bacterium]
MDFEDIVIVKAIKKLNKKHHQILNKTVYLAMGIGWSGYKELLGIWIAEKEGAKFRAQVLTELNNRGVKDVGVFCVATDYS